MKCQDKLLVITKTAAWLSHLKKGVTPFLSKLVN
ncbi:hypothetical protein CECT5772_08074 [Streptococcus equi subsp. ruminatorum CECT 5772]|uniref:Uncharacterized protein n=1 Tax=Streptococcus equi subsp. ruminatorum CECT 5772 TaxID=1051981 RepID=A0A922NSZ7_9STRE|nr:hypothetical protein CECT5772_08074 [Streptococcus equi subsp. ruminatorum CECT 5772]